MIPNFNKLVFFDTETIGFTPPYIISIAFVSYENGKRIKSGYYICNPEVHIPISASKVNGFFDEDVIDKPKFYEIWPNISYYFENSVYIAHNCDFDEKSLHETLNRYNIPMPKKYWTCCTMKNARLLLPKPTVINHKLGTLCEYFSINLDNWHNASADTLACLKVYNKLIELSDGNLKIEKGKYCSEENTDKDDFDF